MTMTDKESVAQLLKETIVQLCKANIFYSGQVEIDGIICISGQVEGQELVIKVHEIFATPQDLRNPYAALACQPLAAKFSDFQSLYGDFHRQDLKRRRLENSFDFHPSFAYSYLSKLVYGQNHPNAFTQPGLDQRNGATDLSIKSSLAASNHRADLQSDGSLSPYQGVETKHDVRDELQPSQTPVRSLLGGKTVLLSDGCVPGKSLLSLLPQCRVCFCSFESPESLSDHNEIAHSVFTCLCCFKTFTSRSNLERHSRLHTGHRPFACDVCGKSFSRKDHLSNHATKHAFKCGACSHRCADRAALVSHCLRDHGASLTNVCAFCNKGFCGAEPYEEHLKSHPQWNAADDDDDAKMNSGSAGSQVAARALSKDRYLCVSCNFETNDKVSVAKHRLVHSGERRLYTCMGCGKIYEDPLQYSDHLILHQKERDIFECCICRQVCGTLSSLRRHEAAHVSDDNSDTEAAAADGDRFRCGKCSRTFGTLQFLREHLEAHELRQSCHLYREPFENPVDLDSYPGAKEGQGHVAPEETNNCVEDCSGATDVASRRDKRKQKQPKPAVNVSSEMVGAGESDIEVTDPRTPGVREDEKSCDFVITDNPACVIQVSGDAEIKMEPAKSILNHATTSAVSIKPRNDSVEPEDRDLSCLMPTKLERPAGTIERGHGNVVNRVRLSAKHRGRGKGRHRETHSSRSGHLLAGLLENRVSPGASPGVDVTSNNNLMSTRNENHPLGGDVPSGPFVCVVCSFEANTFQALDGHCVASHSRSPCMFCAKTFAQKANRDRHHCLHTGDKPYGCPECGEKFSRGDKLKMHRVRAHGVQYPLYGSRHRETSSSRGDREFASSSPGFLSLQSDGFSPMTSAGYLTSFPALPAFEGREPGDDADLRTDGVGVEDADELGCHVSKLSRINSDFAKDWKTERNGSIHWVKTQPKETEVDEENNILEDVAPIN